MSQRSYPTRAKPLPGGPRRPWHQTDAAFGWLLLAPTLLLLVAVSLYPVVRILQLTFYRWNYARSESPEGFVGLRNWERLLSDETFWGSLKTTVVFLGIALPIELAIGLGLALLLNREIRGRGLARALLLPMMMSPVVIALVWKMMYAVPYGPLNALLKGAGLIEQDLLWLASPGLAMTSIVVATVWQWYPFAFLIFSAGLQTIPKEEYEAAAIDGAGPWALLRHLIIPHLASFLLIILLSRLLDGFKTFAIVYNLTGGGPGDATNLISFHVYRTAFASFNLGYGSTLAVALMIVMLAFAGVVLWMTRRAGGRSE
ncbi:MAG: sugar ABC transporter permease [Meiothermus sp.]|nr:sugar ABC transporter permease [Meiothermus sp.]